MSRILLVTEMSLLRSAIATVLSSEPELEVVAQVGGPDVTAALVGEVRADAAVVELGTRGADTLLAVRTISEYAPRCNVLALVDVAASATLHRALGTQVCGFITKECEITHLVDAIRRVAAGERFIEPCIAIAALGAPGNPLTRREVDVLRMVADGMSTTEIATALFLTEGTIRNYLSTIVQKMGARSRLEAVRNAVNAGWL
jgi:two-component system, NarL family, response regulator DesR